MMNIKKIYQNTFLTAQEKLKEIPKVVKEDVYQIEDPFLNPAIKRVLKAEEIELLFDQENP